MCSRWVITQLESCFYLSGLVLSLTRVTDVTLVRFLPWILEKELAPSKIQHSSTFCAREGVRVRESQFWSFLRVVGHFVDLGPILLMFWPESGLEKHRPWNPIFVHEVRLASKKCSQGTYLAKPSFCALSHVLYWIVQTKPIRCPFSHYFWDFHQFIILQVKSSICGPPTSIWAANLHFASQRPSIAILQTNL